MSRQRNILGNTLGNTLAAGIFALAAGTVAMQAAFADSNDSANNAAQENYQVAQKKCNAMSADARDPCLQKAKSVYEGATAGCDGLSDSAKRKCDADTQAKQQSESAQPAQSVTGTTSAPGTTPNDPPR